MSGVGIICACCTTGTSYSAIATSPCIQCDNDEPPDCWEFTVAGVTEEGGSPCVDCSFFNSTFTLYVTTGILCNANLLCCWETTGIYRWDCVSAIENPINGADAKLVVSEPLAGFRRWDLQIFWDQPPLGVGHTDYRLDETVSTAPLCNEDKTLTKNVTGSGCINFPATITLVPVNCP